MRVSAFLFAVACGLLSGESPVHANSFPKDVVSGVANKEHRKLPFMGDTPHNSQMEDELLSKAVPLTEYNNKLRSLGMDPITSDRNLEEQADDFYMNEQNMYSFSGYSLKYAKCQPVQQFSTEALAAGEYSPMVTQDIVILRLCPYKSCSSSRQYGCHYNYAEYAIGLNEYIRIMLRYKQSKKERLCEWCAGCQGNDNNGDGRRLEENQQQQENGEENQNDGQEENQAQENGENNGNQDGNDDYYAAQDDGYNANNNNYNNGNYNDDGNNYDENDECYIYSSYCENYYYDCDAEGEQQQQNQYYYADDYNNNQNQQQQNNYIDEEEYFNYLQCVEIADNYGGIYFVRPSCDVSENKIIVAVFYDEYCSQYAGDNVNADNLNVAFDDSVFEDLYDGSCIDCSESVSKWNIVLPFRLDAIYSPILLYCPFVWMQSIPPYSLFYFTSTP